GLYCIIQASSPPFFVKGFTMTTIIDVAKQANVSPATVSNAFNKPNRVNAQTRERVLAIATEMGFQPNLHAQGLRSQRTGIVGIIVSDIRLYYAATIARSIQERLHQSHKTGLISSTDGRNKDVRTVIEALRQQGVQAFILCPAPTKYDNETLNFLQDLIQNGVQMSFITNELASFSADVALWQAQEGSKMLTRHLIELGHRKIAFVRLPLTAKMAGVKRWLGYQEGMIEAGLPLRPDYIVDGHLGFETGVMAWDKLRQLSDPPTAVMANDDLIAAGVINRCYHLGMHVPKELSVTGFGNYPIAQHISPALTTIGVPLEQLGTQAAELLLERLEDNSLPPRKPLLDYTLIIRESTYKNSSS
ncbi:MAG: LacI family DNA-binding transcriptional regulator, partial [Chloroflexota bacterium]